MMRDRSSSAMPHRRSTAEVQRGTFDPVREVRRFPTMDNVTGRLETLPDEECRRLLAAGKVGRVSVTSDALPVIAPVNYVLDGNTIVFRTRHDGMLARACQDAVIAFEIDELAG